MSLIAFGPYMAQLRRGKSVMQKAHSLMIAAGFQWDGMDGYTAPVGWTEEQSKKLWEEANA